MSYKSRPTWIAKAVFQKKQPHLLRFVMPLTLLHNPLHSFWIRKQSVQF